MVDKNKYPLDTLLKVRREAVDDAKRRLAAAVQHTQQQEERLDRCDKTMNECRAKISAAAAQIGGSRGSTLTARTLAAQQNHLDTLRRQLKDLAVERAETARATERAKTMEEKARELLSQAHREEQVLRKHEQKWKATEDRKRLKAEQEISDEAAVTAYHRQRQNRDQDSHSNRTGNKRR